ncbi:hypothetical protein Prudu_012377 [Prunus dulcis]|uniref:Uncharacterized protein n=1 Tax=Prunus dulcis TaxID=3755 RepID=A0A4Y1RD79_PRUDU|nr:hypothetical protein Prudu_012377 [Prunus dulcis]
MRKLEEYVIISIYWRMVYVPGTLQLNEERLLNGVGCNISLNKILVTGENSCYKVSAHTFDGD